MSENTGRSWQSFTLEQWARWLMQQPITRPVEQIQIHHSWRPSVKTYEGEKTMAAIHRFETAVKKLQDVSAHVYVAPDGMVWNGRALNAHLKDDSKAEQKAIHVEIIGNFNKGKDELGGAELYAATGAVRFLLSKFRLSPEQIKFHRENVNTTCPGSGIDKTWFVSQVLRWPHRLNTQTRYLPKTQPAAMHVQQQAPAFADLPENKQAQKALLKLYKKGILQPDNNAKLGAAKSVTREELALALQMLYDQLKR